MTDPLGTIPIPERRRQAGFTFIEIAIVALILTSAFAVFAQVFQSSDGLVKRSRAALRAHEDLRRNLEAIANVLRGADIDTLGGFDSTGTAVKPTFQRVTGADMVGRTYGVVESIYWVSAPSIDGIANPGRVVHTKGATISLLADRVPQGGFSVTLDGTTLVISLVTYASTSQRETATVSGTTAVAFRN